MIRPAFTAVSLTLGAAFLPGCDPHGQTGQNKDQEFQTRFAAATAQLSAASKRVEKVMLGLRYQEQVGDQGLEPDDDSLSRLQIFIDHEKLLVQAKEMLESYPPFLNIRPCRLVRMRVESPPSTLQLGELSVLVSPRPLTEAQNKGNALMDFKDRLTAVYNADAQKRKNAQDQLPAFERGVADFMKDVMPALPSPDVAVAERMEQKSKYPLPQSPLEGKLLPVRIRLNEEFSQIVHWSLLTKVNMNQCRDILSLYGIVRTGP